MHSFHLHAIVMNIGIVIILLNVSIFRIFDKNCPTKQCFCDQMIDWAEKRLGIKLVLMGWSPFKVCDCRWNPVDMPQRLHWIQYNLKWDFLEVFYSERKHFRFSFCHIHFNLFASFKVRHVFSSIRNRSRNNSNNSSSSSHNGIEVTVAISIHCGCNIKHRKCSFFTKSQCSF